MLSLKLHVIENAATSHAWYSWSSGRYLSQMNSAITFCLMRCLIEKLKSRPSHRCECQIKSMTIRFNMCYCYQINCTRFHFWKSIDSCHIDIFNLNLFTICSLNISHYSCKHQQQHNNNTTETTTSASVMAAVSYFVKFFVFFFRISRASVYNEKFPKRVFFVSNRCDILFIFPHTCVFRWCYGIVASVFTQFMLIFLSQ